MKQFKENMKILELDKKPVINLDAKFEGQDHAIMEFKKFSEEVL